MGSEACAFHFEALGMQGIELYALESRGILGRTQSFWSPDCRERVDCCMILVHEWGVQKVYTSPNIDSLKFPFSSPSLKRSNLTDEEAAYFARSGVNVVSLDKIS